MKIPYPFVFRSGGSGEDGEIAACGMPNSFMRLLFSLLDFPITFYNGDNRVNLSDSENQLIELGTAALSKLFISGGCSMLVADRILTADAPANPNTLTPLLFAGGSLNGDFLEYDTGTGEFTILVGGTYTVLMKTVVRFNTMPNADFSQFGAVDKNGVFALLDENFRRAGRLATVSCPGILSLVSGDKLAFQYFHTASQSISVQDTISTAVMLYHG